MPYVVYRSDDLLVKAAHRGGEVCIVSFDAFTDTKNLDRPAFAEHFLQDQQISAVHFVNGRNRWYHEPDWQDAIDAVSQSLRAYPRVVTYGSSMEGYAALAFARHLGAHSVLALSPQYSRDPRKVPFETRWWPHRRERWLPELSGPLPSDVPAILVYDPMVSADRRHANCIAEEMPVSRLTLPFVGHGSAAFLAEVGLLAPLLLSFAGGTVDLSSIARAARDSRRSSTQYLTALAEAAHGRGYFDLALTLARRASVASPLKDGPWHVMGRVYDHTGDFDQAFSAHVRAARLAPHAPVIQFWLALAQRRAGNIDIALQILTQLAQQPLPKHSARKVINEIWYTRILLCIAAGELFRQFQIGRSKMRARARSRPTPCRVRDGLEADP
ncbi:tetratricopeptide repeat protein [Bosea sp. AAP35]|uniref:tetratricopeptide repeat protein n=1 Tax=Bosea sp. AAP35 TaxID=1523417 RepID=UPI000A7E030F|nr:tetratricopeptide repeat protein [Bosea sp. AAP35]